MTTCERPHVGHKPEFLTPTEVLSLKVKGLEAQLQLADERAYWLKAEIAALRAGQLERANVISKTHP